MYSNCRVRSAVLASAAFVALGLGSAGGARADSGVPTTVPVLAESAPGSAANDAGPGVDRAMSESVGDAVSESTTPVPPQGASPAPSPTPPAAATVASKTSDPVAPLAALVVSKPTAPRSPTAVPGNASVKLTWLAPSSNGGVSVDRYRVRRATSPAGPWTAIGRTTKRKFTATGLTNGTRYYFRIAAHNAAGWSPASTVVNSVPFTTPSAPSSCSAVQWGGPGSHTIVIQWGGSPNDGGSPAILYEVDATMSGVNYGHALKPPGAGFVAWQVPYGWYEVRVWAVNAAGSGPSCTAWVFMWWP